jgi:hypothetical protein
VHLRHRERAFTNALSLLLPPFKKPQYYRAGVEQKSNSVWTELRNNLDGCVGRPSVLLLGRPVVHRLIARPLNLRQI